MANAPHVLDVKIEFGFQIFFRFEQKSIVSQSFLKNFDQSNTTISTHESSLAQI